MAGNFGLVIESLPSGELIEKNQANKKVKGRVNKVNMLS